MRWLVITVFIVLCVGTVRAGQEDGADCLRRGESSLSAGDYRRSLREFSAAARLMPDSAAAWRGIGLSRFRLGAREEMTDPAMLTDAASAFTTALQLKPDFAEVRFLLGLTYLALDNRDRAREEYEALRGLDRALADRLLASIDKHRAVPSFREVGSKGEAEDNMTRVAISGNQVVVPTIIGYGERVVEARLVLDTGASATVISPGIAASLGITPDRTGRGLTQVVGGSLLETAVVKLNRITVGPCTKTSLNVHIIPHRGPSVNFDGLLGMDFLRGLTYHIDFQRSLITWGK